MIFHSSDEGNFHLRLLKSLMIVMAIYYLLPSHSMANDTNNCSSKYGLNTCPTPYDLNIPSAKDMLQWDKKERAIGFRNTFRQYPADIFRAIPDNAYELPISTYNLSNFNYSVLGIKYSLDEYIKHQDVAGLLILKNGKIVHEYYGKGNTESTLWTSRSVAKSIVTVLVGAALEDGYINSVDDLIIKYVPDLKGTAWSDVTLHQLMQHTSGVEWNEDYTDPTSHFSQMTYCEAGPKPFQCLMALVKSLKRKPEIAPGQEFSYTTAGAWLVGYTLEQATGQTLGKYLEAKIWQPYGMEQDGIWQALIPGKVDMGGHGFNATLRDWGRLALFIENGGELQGGNRVLPKNWINRSTSWVQADNSKTFFAPEGQYGYQWWNASVLPDFLAGKINPKNTFAALGIFGQAILIDQTEDLVLVQWSTWDNARGSLYLHFEQAFFFNDLINYLHGAEK